MVKLIIYGVTFAVLLTGCSPELANYKTSPATLTPPTPSRKELFSLPKPRGKIKVAVYGFRDQTGQYKPIPNVSSFSTAVTSV